MSKHLNTVTLAAALSAGLLAAAPAPAHATWTITASGCGGGPWSWVRSSMAPSGRAELELFRQNGPSGVRWCAVTYNRAAGAHRLYARLARVGSYRQWVYLATDDGVYRSYASVVVTLPYGAIAQANGGDEASATTFRSNGS